MVFTLADLKRFPGTVGHPVHRVFRQRRPRLSPRAIRTDLTPQQIDGLTSTSEWTGVPLATLLPRSRRVAEGAVVPRRGRWTPR